MAIITLAEARELYKQGGVAKEVALREFSELEILNDYTMVTELFDVFPSDAAKIYSKLCETYKHIIAGREYPKDETTSYYSPVLKLHPTASCGTGGEQMCLVKVNNVCFKYFIDIVQVPMDNIAINEQHDFCFCVYLNNRKWLFRDIKICRHFVKHFYREMLISELGDLYKIEFFQDQYTK